MKKIYSGILILLLSGTCSIMQAQSLEQKIDSTIDIQSFKNKPGVEIFVKKKI